MENRKPKYGIGDKVRCIKYGHLFWETKNEIEELNKINGIYSGFPIIGENGNIVYKDMSPELVGQEFLIKEVSTVQEIPHYSVDNPTGKTAWYYEDQLELVIKNPANEIT